MSVELRTLGFDGKEQLFKVCRSRGSNPYLELPRIDLWKKQDFLSILKKHQKSLKINKISRPLNYLPLNNDFKNKIKIKIVLLQKY